MNLQNYNAWVLKYISLLSRAQKEFMIDLKMYQIIINDTLVDSFLVD